MKRRKKENNYEEESSEAQTFEVPSTIILRREFPLSLLQIEATIIDFLSPSSPCLRKHSIFSIFLEMKKNEVLKNSTYENFWKQCSTTYTRLLSYMNNEKGQ